MLIRHGENFGPRDTYDRSLTHHSPHLGVNMSVIDIFRLIGLDISPDGLTPHVGIIFLVREFEDRRVADKYVHIREFAEFLCSN